MSHLTTRLALVRNRSKALWGLVAALVIVAAPSQAAVGAAGIDCWLTEPGSTFPLALPAGFFGIKNGTPSDPVLPQVIAVEGLPLPPNTCDCQNNTSVEWLDAHGTPVDPDSRHRVSQVITVDPYDTCVERLQDTTFAGGVGVPEMIDIEILALSLTSVSPIMVTYGAEPPSLFDLFVTLDGPQPQGAMSFNPAQTGPSANGTLTLQSLPVDFRIDFQEVGGPGIQALTDLNLSFEGTRGTFAPLFASVLEIPTVTEWGLALLALAILSFGILWLRRRQVAGS